MSRRGKTRALMATAGAAALTCVPGVANACAVCFDASAENRGAFLGTTILLTLLPLAMIGGVSFVVWRRAKALDAESAA